MTWPEGASPRCCPRAVLDSILRHRRAEDQKYLQFRIRAHRGQDRRRPRGEGGGAPNPGAPAPCRGTGGAGRRRDGVRHAVLRRGNGGAVGAHGAVMEAELRRWYLRPWDNEYLLMFPFGRSSTCCSTCSTAATPGGRHWWICAPDECVQRRTFESYLYKRMVPGEPWGISGCCGGWWSA